jgi:hypothetical protein
MVEVQKIIQKSRPLFLIRGYETGKSITILRSTFMIPVLEKQRADEHRTACNITESITGPVFTAIQRTESILKTLTRE